MNQRTMLPALTAAALAAIAFFGYKALRDEDPPPVMEPPVRGTRTTGPTDPGEPGPDSAVNEREATDLLARMGTWNRHRAKEAVELLQPDPMRKLAAIIEGGGTTATRLWAIQVAAALSADPNWEQAATQPPPQPAPLADARVREAIAFVAGDARQDPILRVTALAVLPLELEGCPLNDVADMMAGIVERESGGGATVTAFDRLSQWFEAGHRRLGEAVEQAALSTMARGGDAESRKAASRALRWGDPRRTAKPTIEALSREEDSATRATFLETLRVTAPMSAAWAWSEGKLSAATPEEEPLISRVVAHGVRSSPGDATAHAVARVRLQDRAATGTEGEVADLAAAVAHAGKESGALEFLAGLTARGGIPAVNGAAIDRAIKAARNP